MRRLLACVLLALALAACGGEDDAQPLASSSGRQTASPTVARTPTPAAEPTETRAVTPEPASPLETAPPTDPSRDSVKLLEPVDKQHGLTAGYVPPNLTTVPGEWLAPGFGGMLRQEGLAALVDMLSTMQAEGYDVRVRSAYRSYEEQAATFAYWVSVLGEGEASRVSARAGHSEHQLGTTVDLTSAEVGWDLTQAFGSTAAGQWLQSNAWRYGFALSYPEGGEPVTGYKYEPWHYRYIGTDHAQAWAGSGLTLIEYLRSVAG